MQGLAVLLLSCGSWLIFTGYQSLDPLKTAQDVLKDPAHASDVIAGGVAAVANSKSPRDDTQTATTDPANATPAGVTGSGPMAEQAYAQTLFPTYGWGVDQMSFLVQLWNRESSWNPSAKNPSSGAYGIPQALPAAKMATAGADYMTNYKTQIKWGLGYIASRYGSPQKAWAHEVSAGWY